MCGIVGYIGNKNTKDVLINGLRKLEYRGYDSAGIALKTEDGINIYKENGKLEKLEKKVKSINIESIMGIGHTRWATHGKPSDVNSHPHFNKNKTIAIVHNGIIENYIELKNKLIEEDYKFVSETDTEVIAHLLDKNYDGNPLEAVLKTIKELKGSYALGIIFNDDKEHVYCAKKGSPLIVGKGKNENYIASDIPAVLEYTRKVYIMEDDEVGIISQDEIKFLDSTGRAITKEITEVTWSIESAEKGGYDHYMQKEIFEQPKVVKDTLAGRLSIKGKEVAFENFDLDIEKFDKIYFVACGTAYHAGLIGKYIIEKLVRIPIFTNVSSEFRYSDPIVDEKTLVVTVSQSGETADTLAAIKLAKEKGATTLGIVNVVGSSIDRISDYTIYTLAGPEIAVASTKAYTAQVICMYLFAVYIGMKKGYINEDDFELFKKEMLSIPQKIESILSQNDDIKAIVKKYIKSKNVFFIGRGMDYYVAREGALKLKEVAYLHCEAYEAGELKHGPIALMENSTLVIGVLLDEDLIDKMISNLKEVKARGAKVLAITQEGTNLGDVADDVIYVPKIEWAFTSVLANIPQQIIAYYMAILLDNDVDKPRNLAKSVTVE